MAQNQNGFPRRSSSATRTYPGTAARLTATTTNTTTPLVLVDGFSPTRPGAGAGARSGASSQSTPTVFVRPLSRTQLAPIHISSTTTTSSSTSTSRQLLSPQTQTHSSGTAPPVAARPISLDQPRPDSERHRNLYLGAPISLNTSGGGGGGGGGGHVHSHSHSHTHSGNSSTNYQKGYVDSTITAAEQVRLPTNLNSQFKKKYLSSHSSDINSQNGFGGVVTIQPTSNSKRTLLEDSVGGGVSGDEGKLKLPESSIMCPYCRKCRCEACSTPRSLPSRWICSKSVHCGPEPCLDYLTCLCCVKAVFYHCGKDHEPDGGVMCADKPCSCAPHRKFWRWGCMTAMSLVLPCLCLYWPCKGCIKVTEKAYQKYYQNGCTCQQNQNGTTRTATNTNTLSSRSRQGQGGGGGGDETSEDESPFPHTQPPMELPTKK